MTDRTNAPRGMHPAWDEIGSAWFVEDENGEVAGPFDTEAEAAAWIEAHCPPIGEDGKAVILEVEPVRLPRKPAP
jgi:hypothetical protein